MNNEVEEFLEKYAYKKYFLIKNAEFLNEVKKLPISRKKIYQFLKNQNLLDCSYDYFCYLLREEKTSTTITKTIKTQQSSLKPPTVKKYQKPKKAPKKRIEFDADYVDEDELQEKLKEIY